MSLESELTYLVNSGEITEFDILTAINEIKSISHIKEEKHKQTEQIYFPKQEKQNHFYLLSKDAVLAVEYILDLLDPIAVKNRIELILRKRFKWGRRYTLKIISEIKDYLRHVDRLEY